MQRFLLTVVLLSVGALLPARAAGQAKGAATSVPEPTKGGGKPAATKAPSKAPATNPGTSKIAVAPKGSGESAEPKPGEQLSDEAELSRIVGLYEAGKYTECSSEVERLLDPTSRDPLRQPSIVENARVYWAACLLGAGEREAADAPLRAAIHENPQMKPPDSLVFPGPVVERFLQVRDSLVNEIRAAEQARFKQAQEEARQRKQDLDRDRDRLRQLERLAEQESVVVRNRRVLSFVPFGVGQLQNREETLGYTLMASEVLFGGLSIAAIATQSKLATEGENQARDGRVVDNAGLISGWGVVKRVSAWTFVALAVGGVVQAQFAYVPEFRETRRRRLPKAVHTPTTGLGRVDVTWLPSLNAQGGGLDIVGRF